MTNDADVGVGSHIDAKRNIKLAIEAMHMTFGEFELSNW